MLIPIVPMPVHNLPCKELMILDGKQAVAPAFPNQISSSSLSKKPGKGLCLYMGKFLEGSQRCLL